MPKFPIVIHNSLNPDIWEENYNLISEIRLDLLKIANDFYLKTKFEAPILDIYFMGSLASFNWNINSDIDIHVLIDIKNLNMPIETAIKMLKVVSSQWNSEHNIQIKNHKVEMNIQDISIEKPYVNGIFSLVKNVWIKKPSRQNLEGIDKSLIQIKYTGLKQYINTSIKSNNQETMKKAKDYLDSYRQYGLDNRGELSIENLVYKLLRKKGLIKKLKNSMTQVYDKEYSIDEGTYPTDARFGLGAIGSFDQVLFKEFPRDIFSAQSHGFNGNPMGRCRFRYLDGVVEWSDCQTPTEEQKHLVDTSLERKGYPVKKHSSIYDDDNELDWNVHRMDEINNDRNVDNLSDITTTNFKMIFGDDRISKGAGIIFLNNDIWFANAIKLWGLDDKLQGWCINRHQGAWDLKLPEVREKFKTPQVLLNWLQTWYDGLKLNEVTQSNITPRLPINGNVSFDRLTLDNLKAMKLKALRAWKYGKEHNNEEMRIQANQDFISYDTEIKKRLELINRPITEGYKDWIPVVTGVINSKGEILSTLDTDDSHSSHYGLGYHYGEKWRYNPKTKIVYWRQEQPEEYKHSVENHLYKKYGFKVKAQMNLDFKGGEKYLNVAHGIYESCYNENMNFVGDPDEDFMERRDKALCEMADHIKNKKGKIHWTTISATLLQKTWLLFGKYNKVNENAIDKIADQILTNIAKLQAANEIQGHSENYYVREEIKDNCGIEFTDEEWNNIDYDMFTDSKGNDFLSDYGIRPLQKLYFKIYTAETPEEKLYACDKALNVVHQRNDLAAMFVEGGQTTLTKIANQGGYNAGYEYGQVNREFRENIINESISHPPSQEFKRWFGNSKVVDSAGNPLVVYHGTNQPISAFSKKRLGISTQSQSSKKAYFFTDSSEVAAEYAAKAGRTVRSGISDYEKKIKELQKKVERLEAHAQATGNWTPYEKAMEEYENYDIGTSREDDETGQNILPVFLKIENPLIYDFEGKADFNNKTAGLIDVAVKSGNDGLILKNVNDPLPLSTHYIVFKPTQIKSAIGNVGTYSHKHSSIVKENEDHTLPLTAFTSGYCAEFALALHEKTKYSIVSFDEHIKHDEDDIETQSIHYACKHNNLYYDARGKRTEEEIRKNLLGSDMKPTTNVEVRELSADDLENETGIEPEALEQARKIVSRMKNIKEGVGAGIPEQDPLHIKDKRWQIDITKRKTPSLKENIDYNKEFIKDFRFSYKQNAGGKSEIMKLNDPVEIKRRLDFVYNNNKELFLKTHSNSTIDDYNAFIRQILKSELEHYKKLKM